MAETWPAGLIPNEAPQWGIESHTLSLESPWTRTAQHVRLQGARWQVTTTFRSLGEDQQRELVGFLDFLEGPTKSVAMPVWLHDELRGNAAGTILATGAAHATVISMTGVTGAQPAFRRGDLIGIGDRLHRVTKDVGHDAGTIAAVNIAPGLRVAVSGAAVATTGLTCPMRLVGDGQAIGRFRPRFGEWSLTWVEALP